MSTHEYEFSGERGWLDDYDTDPDCQETLSEQDEESTVPVKERTPMFYESNEEILKFDIVKHRGAEYRVISIQTNGLLGLEKLGDSRFKTKALVNDVVFVDREMQMLSELPIAKNLLSV